MKFRISLIIKILLLVSITFGITFFYIFSHNLEVFKKSFMESEREKATVILRTFVPIVSISKSFENESYIEEQIKELKKHNKDIIEIKISDEIITNPISESTPQYIIEKIRIPDFFDHQKTVGSILIKYSNHNYLDMVENYKKTIIFSFFIVILVLIALSFALYYSFLPLKKLSLAVRNFDFQKTDIPAIDSKIENEVTDISKAIDELLLKISIYAKELNNLNTNLQNKVDEKTKELLEFNQNLQIKISEAVEKIRAQDSKLIKQSRHAAMGETIDSIAHQWKQPLSILSIVIQDIKDAYEHNELSQEYMDKSIKTSLDCIFFMSQTINDFRDFFKPQKNKNIFLAVDAIEYAIRMTNGMFKKHNIKILINGDKTITAFGYKNELAQVVINVLNNAKDEIEKKCENQNIFIKISKTDKCAVIEVEDCAGGIDENIIDKIFEQYFSTKTDEKGTGIGLYMSKMIIEDGMNGKIEAKNKKDEFGNNMGAIFTIKLPKEDSIICK